MEVFKFGGASVKSADAINNLASILKVQNTDLIVVISAMDKTTNALEKLLQKYFNNIEFDAEWNFIYNFHKEIVQQLFDDSSKFHITFRSIFEKLKNKLNQKPSTDFDKEYDSIVSYGEILSTLIISNYLNKIGVNNIWLDARDIIKTDSYFRAASVDFEKTQQELNKHTDFNKSKIYITQGFIGSDEKDEVTTLGREGSDYTAAVIANLLNATNLTLWKDVAGIYNADPKMLKETTKLKKISYREATELAYFGAKIIHPKTAKPLMQKNISLTIKSFNDINEEGTTVFNYGEKIEPKVPVYIYSNNQILLTISSNDFIDEHLFEKVFASFKQYKTKINLMQNSALNLSLCFDYNENNFDMLISDLKTKFELKYNSDLTLITIRHYNQTSIEKCIKDKKIILEQKNRLNAFYLIQN